MQTFSSSSIRKPRVSHTPSTILASLEAYDSIPLSIKRQNPLCRNYDPSQPQSSASNVLWYTCGLWDAEARKGMIESDLPSRTATASGTGWGTRRIGLEGYCSEKDIQRVWGIGKRDALTGQPTLTIPESLWSDDAAKEHKVGLQLVGWLKGKDATKGDTDEMILEALLRRTTEIKRKAFAAATILLSSLGDPTPHPLLGVTQIEQARKSPHPDPPRTETDPDPHSPPLTPEVARRHLDRGQKSPINPRQLFQGEIDDFAETDFGGAHDEWQDWDCQGRSQVAFHQGNEGGLNQGDCEGGQLSGKSDSNDIHAEDGNARQALDRGESQNPITVFSSRQAKDVVSCTSCRLAKIQCLYKGIVPPNLPLLGLATESTVSPGIQSMPDNASISPIPDNVIAQSKDRKSMSCDSCQNKKIACDMKAQMAGFEMRDLAAEYWRLVRRFGSMVMARPTRQEDDAVSNGYGAGGEAVRSLVRFGTGQETLRAHRSSVTLEAGEGKDLWGEDKDDFAKKRRRGKNAGTNQRNAQEGALS